MLPSEGSTGWSDTWMIAAKAKHPNCMYKWMNWITTPKVQAQVAEWFGEAPANRKACSHTAAKDHCKIFHEADEPYFNRVAFWTTPIKQLRRRAAATSAPTTRSGSRPGRTSRADALTAVPASVPGRSVSRRLADLLHGHRAMQLSLLLAGPLGWLVIAYLGSLAVLFVAAFWHLDEFSGKVVHSTTARPTSRRCGTATSIARSSLRTVGIAAAVTVTDVLLAFPIAFYMAKIATPRRRAACWSSRC